MATLKQKVDVKEKVGERVGARTYAEMLGLALKGQLDSKTLNEKEVKILVDCLAFDDRNAKFLKKNVDSGKPTLLEYAKENRLISLYGDLSMAKISDKTETDLSASKAIKILEKEGKMKLLDEILTVSVTNFKRYLGADIYDRAATKNVHEFASISLKKREGNEHD